MPLTRLFILGTLLVGACVGQLNPSVPTPQPGELAAKPGVWVAYNLGCDLGCDRIKRGDTILAVDGRPVTSGAEIDLADLARGTPVRLTVQRRVAQEPITIDLLAEPNEYLPPLAHVPPLWTVGAGALDRAPSWARLKAFGHATPAMRLYRIDEPRAYVTGRELFGRGALIVYWLPDGYVQQLTRKYYAMLPGFYERLQSRDAELQTAGVDSLFMLPRRVVESERDYIRSAVPPLDASDGYVPIFVDASSTRNGNTVGLEHQAADFREMLFRDGRYGPIILILDRRGIVRWHSRGYHEEDPAIALEAAIDFALTQLEDGPEPVPAPLAVRDAAAAQGYTTGTERLR